MLRARWPAAAAAAAAWFLLPLAFLAAAPHKAEAAAAAAAAAARIACPLSAPLDQSSFRLSFKSARTLVDSFTQQPWRRYCFTLTKEVLSDDPADDTPGATRPCDPATHPCCTSESKGPMGLSSLSIYIDPACAVRGGAAGAALTKTWWSLGGPRSSRGNARLAGVRAKLDKAAARPFHELTLRPGEGDVWTATELCVHLADVPGNPCRTLGQLCGNAGCRVTAVTSKFVEGLGRPAAACCLSNGSLPVGYRCSPVCRNGGTCVAENVCDCSNTGFGGPDCAQSIVPRPIATWSFDECQGRSTPDAAGGSGAYAWVGANAEYVDQCTGAVSRAGCAVRFNSTNCCTDGYQTCPTKTAPNVTVWCDSLYNGSIVTVTGRPGPTGSPDWTPNAVAFGGLTSLTVSVWVRPALVKHVGLVGRSYDFPQFSMGIGIPGTWNPRPPGFEVCFGCLPGGNVSCSGFACFAARGDAVPVAAWTHLVGVFRRGEVHIYQDGVHVGSTQLPAPYDTAALPVWGTAPLYAGGHPAWTIFEGGMLDCLAFWREGLEDAQVHGLYLESQQTCGCGN